MLSPNHQSQTYYNLEEVIKSISVTSTSAFFIFIIQNIHHGL